VLYKKQEIGEVTDLQLSTTRDSIAVEVLIYEQYTYLIKHNTRFYTISGFQLDASLQGISLQTSSLNAIIAGGISFLTPDNGEQISKGQVFPLYAGREQALQAGSLFLTLEFLHGNNIRSGTKIKYKGVTIGTLVRTWYNPEKDRVFAKAAVQQKFKRLFLQTTEIWLAQPTVNLSGVKHLETLFSGAYLDLLPGNGAQRTHFAVRDSEPELSAPGPGLHLVLEAERIGSLKKESPIYYRQVEIGKITGIELGPTAQMVWIHVVIAPKYTPLVRRSSRFWNAGGVKVIAGLFSGVSVETESLESIMTGGIAMATPEEPGTPAQENDHFLLAKEVHEDWLTWSPKLSLQNQENVAEQHRIQAGKKKKRVSGAEKR
jgi:paraquat-inducible protein B